MELIAFSNLSRLSKRSFSYQLGIISLFFQGATERFAS